MKRITLGTEMIFNMLSAYRRDTNYSSAAPRIVDHFRSQGWDMQHGNNYRGTYTLPENQLAFFLLSIS